MDTHAQTITTQAQSMTAHDNREVDPHVNLSATIMASRPRNFTRINFPMFCGSKVNEDPQDFQDDVYKIVHAMVVTSI